MTTAFPNTINAAAGALSAFALNSWLKHPIYPLTGAVVYVISQHVHAYLSNRDLSCPSPKIIHTAVLVAAIATTAFFFSADFASWIIFHLFTDHFMVPILRELVELVRKPTTHFFGHRAIA